MPHETNPEDKIVLNCNCGKSKNCPEATYNPDGSVTLVDADGPGPVQTIHLKPGAALLLKDFLNKKI